MIKKFELRNYKNFKDNIVVNFGKVGSYEFGTDCITDNLISMEEMQLVKQISEKLLLIYH